MRLIDWWPTHRSRSSRERDLELIGSAFATSRINNNQPDMPHANDSSSNKEYP